MPAPSDLAPYPTVAKIQQRDQLVVGVDEGTASWGYRNPRTGTIEGLDVWPWVFDADATSGRQTT